MASRGQIAQKLSFEIEAIYFIHNIHLVNSLLLTHFVDILAIHDVYILQTEKKVSGF